MQIDLQKLKLTNRLLAQEALARGWQVEVVDYRLGLLSYRAPQIEAPMIFHSTVGPFTRAADVIMLDDKLFTTQLAAGLGVAVPETILYTDDDEARAFLGRHNSVVVKPLDGAHGNGVTTEISSWSALQDALAKARQFSRSVLIQEQVYGDDIRTLCIGGKFVAAAKRTPAHVIGDGRHSIRQLIELENASPDRGLNYQKRLNKINLRLATDFLGDRIENTPADGEVVQVVQIVNIGVGGTATNVTASIDWHVIEAAESLASHLRLAICGIDFMVSESGDAKMIELNANPSFGLHVVPSVGEPIPLPKIYLDWIESQLKGGAQW